MAFGAQSVVVFPYRYDGSNGCTEQCTITCRVPYHVAANVRCSSSFGGVWVGCLLRAVGMWEVIDQAVVYIVF